MSNIGKITEDIINRSPFLRESLTEELINVSALARKIKPEIEDIVKKEIKEGAIIMAIKRMSPGYYHRINLKIKNFMGTLGDFLVRSDLEDFTFENSETLTLRQSELMKSLNDDKDAFYTYCGGVNESTVITSTSISDKIREIFKKEKLKSHTSDLASITIKLPKVNTEISGIYYYILKHLAWEGINIVEVVSTANEFTAVVKSDDIDSAFSVLIQLKKLGKVSE
ncbi:MAG: aspartate kinase [Crocinitomicaceae bacterium]|nr:aspartate kinase [Crocinitomicaceae bacterium]